MSEGSEKLAKDFDYFLGAFSRYEDRVTALEKFPEKDHENPDKLKFRRCYRRDFYGSFDQVKNPLMYALRDYEKYGDAEELNSLLALIKEKLGITLEIVDRPIGETAKHIVTHVIAVRTSDSGK